MGRYRESGDAMKIVHVSDCFLPRLGGIEIQLAELVRMQKASGHEVEIITATPDRTTQDEHEADRPTALSRTVSGEMTAVPGGVAVHRIAAGIPFDLPVHPRTGRHVGALLARLRPDVVHLHVGAISPFAWAAARAAARRRLPMVVTVHSMWDPATSVAYRLLDAAYGWSGWPGIFTAVSQAAAEPIRSVVGQRVPVHVVANGIDTADWHQPVPSPRSGPPDRGGVHVVAVGRLAPRKKPLALLRILRTAQDRLAKEEEDWLRTVRPPGSAPRSSVTVRQVA